MSLNEKTIEQKYEEHMRMKKACGKAPLRFVDFKANLEANNKVITKR